jgi:hypothetical protein
MAEWIRCRLGLFTAPRRTRPPGGGSLRSQHYGAERFIKLTSGEQKESEPECVITLPRRHCAIRSPPRLERSAASIAKRDGKHAEEALGGSRRFEPLHLALSSPHNTFNLQRHLIPRSTLRKFRAEATAVARCGRGGITLGSHCALVIVAVTSHRLVCP